MSGEHCVKFEGEHLEYGLLSCDTLHRLRWLLPASWNNLLPLSSGSKYW